jgi:ATP-dependent RNA helicase RhlE
MTDAPSSDAPPVHTFSTLGLSDPLVRAVADLDYGPPTAVQIAAIPILLRGEDVWASAQTGSGKTAAFLLPLLERLRSPRTGSPSALRALILVPTRELAVQIVEAIRSFGCRLPVPPKTALAIGGVSINPQMMALRGGADILVATPGRLLDLVGKNAVVLSSLEFLVLDEADRLLSLGFEAELADVLRLVPAKRQTLLFSATFPPAVCSLAEGVLRSPVRIDVGAAAAPTIPLILQRAIEVDEGTRTLLLRHLLNTHPWPQVLVFVATKYGADHVAMKLQRAGFAAGSLHGELSQGARSQALADFKSTKLRVLVATDVAARGLDIAGLAAVVNYDLPRSPVDYVHRIGRTGRAGERGVAISFVTAATDAHFRLIEKKNRAAIEREQIPGFEPKDLAVPPRDPNGGIKGRGKSKKDKLREAAGLTIPGVAVSPPKQPEPLFPWSAPSRTRPTRLR